MNNEKYQQIIDEAYKNYLKHNDEVDNYWINKNPEIESRWKPYSKEEFINKCITDIEFSKRWGVTIYTEVEEDKVWMGIVYNGNTAKIKIK